MKNIKIGDCFTDTSDDSSWVFDGSDNPNSIALKSGSLSKYLPAEMLGHKHAALPTLHLPIGNSPKYGGTWFDMILSGVKKEEYREIKPFNSKRLGEIVVVGGLGKKDVPYFAPKHNFKVLHLTNGYGHDKPQLWAHIESISIGRGNPEWGAPTDRDVFIIRLGDVFHTKNLKK